MATEPPPDPSNDRSGRADAPAQASNDDLREANEHLVLATIASNRLEEVALDAKRRQDEFLAMLAHELRNPLAPIRSAATLLGRLDIDDPRLKTITEVIRRQVDHMVRLLDDLLDVSRVTSGKVTLQRQPTQVSNFVDQAIDICRAHLEARKQHLTLDLPDLPIYVDGDATRLAQIVGNLLHNAAKYTPEGGHIAIRARAVQGTVELRVLDDGRGIAAEALPQIFDLFAQEERSLNRSEGGLGIGLTVVRSMVERHGGTVEATSGGRNAGSEFIVTLPRMEAPSALVPALIAKPEPAPARILIVDDNMDAANLLSMVLKTSGFDVEVAYDGANALRLFAAQRSQVVVCDIGLPVMNGFEVVKRMREQTRGDEPLLIACTGYEGAEHRKRSLAAGFDHHVAKPLDYDELLRLIEQAHIAR